MFGERGFFVGGGGFEEEGVFEIGAHLHKPSFCNHGERERERERFEVKIETLKTERDLNKVCVFLSLSGVVGVIED